MHFSDSKKVSYSRYGMDNLRIQVNQVGFFRSSETLMPLSMESFENENRYLTEAI